MAALPWHFQPNGQSAAPKHGGVSREGEFSRTRGNMKNRAARKNVGRRRQPQACYPFRTTYQGPRAWVAPGQEL